MSPMWCGVTFNSPQATSFNLFFKLIRKHHPDIELLFGLVLSNPLGFTTRSENFNICFSVFGSWSYLHGFPFTLYHWLDLLFIKIIKAFFFPLKDLRTVELWVHFPPLNVFNLSQQSNHGLFFSALNEILCTQTFSFMLPQWNQKRDFYNESFAVETKYFSINIKYFRAAFTQFIVFISRKLYFSRYVNVIWSDEIRRDKCNIHLMKRFCFRKLQTILQKFHFVKSFNVELQFPRRILFIFWSGVKPEQDRRKRSLHGHDWSKLKFFARILFLRVHFLLFVKATAYQEGLKEKGFSARRNRMKC